MRSGWHRQSLLFLSCAWRASDSMRSCLARSRSACSTPEIMPTISATAAWVYAFADQGRTSGSIRLRRYRRDLLNRLRGLVLSWSLAFGGIRSALTLRYFARLRIASPEMPKRSASSVCWNVRVQRHQFVVAGFDGGGSVKVARAILRFVFCARNSCAIEMTV